MGLLRGYRFVLMSGSVSATLGGRVGTRVRRVQPRYRRFAARLVTPQSSVRSSPDGKQDRGQVGVIGRANAQQICDGRANNIYRNIRDFDPTVPVLSPRSSSGSGGPHPPVSVRAPVMAASAEAPHPHPDVSRQEAV